MTTDELIELLTHDTRPVRPFRVVYLVAVLSGAAMSGLVFFVAIGVRPDFDAAVRSGRFLMKFAVTIPLAAGASGLAMTMSSPGARNGRWLGVLAFGLALLLAMVAVELWLLPPRMWWANMIGHNARFCLTIVPLLSFAPLACLMVVLRRGAPGNPGLAGATAGLAAATIAATYYAANCDDDSPLFVALWYPLAIAAVMAVGFGLGRRFLAW